jgi:High potential iron-sulfur protein
MDINRRTFAIRTIVGTASLAAAELTRAEEALLLESQAQARNLGYRADAAMVDRASFPRYAPGQTCASCQMFRPRPGASDTGPCAIFPGKLVSGRGWCDAYIGKA